MDSFIRVFKSRDLEIFEFLRDHNVVSYIVIEDTRKPLSQEDKKIDPFCYMDEEDIDEILNVFKISFVSDLELDEEDSLFLKNFFNELLNITNLTTMIFKNFVVKDLYDNEFRVDTIPFFNRLLDCVKSDVKLNENEINDSSWMYLSQY
ncbi:MAG: terpene synthase [Kurthia gibsonii]